MSSESEARRAPIYCRVSTAEEVAGTSLDSRRAMCERYCEARGWTIHDVYLDEGVSGAARSRPGLDELLRSVRRREADVVVIAKLDRLGRTMRGLVEWMSDWDDQGVTLVAVSESFDSSSPTTRIQRNLLAMFAEFERDRITERMSEGRDATVAMGGWPGGAAPFGWRLIRNKSDRFTRLEIDEQEATWPPCGCRSIHVAMLDDLVWRTLTERLFDELVIPAGSSTEAEPQLALPGWVGPPLLGRRAPQHHVDHVLGGVAPCVVGGPCEVTAGHEDL